MTARTVPAPHMSEKDLLEGVLQLARMFGYRRAHFRPALTKYGWRTAVQGDGKGFFDLVLIRPPRVLLVELKSDTGRLSLDQREWVDDAKHCPGVECYVWRPGALDDIARILR